MDPAHDLTEPYDAARFLDGRKTATSRRAANGDGSNASPHSASSPTPAQNGCTTSPPTRPPPASPSSTPCGAGSASSNRSSSRPPAGPAPLGRASPRSSASGTVTPRTAATPRSPRERRTCGIGEPIPGRGRVGHGAYQPQQRHPADRRSEPPAQPRSRSAAQCQCDRTQGLAQPDAAAAVSDGQAGHLLAEDLLRTSLVQAEEAADLQVDQRLATGDGGRWWRRARTSVSLSWLLIGSRRSTAKVFVTVR